MVVRYRPDIDGLRALAVLSVVMFHAFPSVLNGGFVGVDVFFVISGYLISSIILSTMDAGTFSFGSFYARRVNRLCPALIVVLITVYAFGWFALLPYEYETLSKHILGGLLFVSNFVLLREAGYFDVHAATKPLLHLWSLAIEEQFYIAWPLLLFAARRFVPKLIPALILAIIAISFLSNVIMIGAAPKFAFYLPLTRAWELMVGGLLAYVRFQDRESRINFVHAQSTIGFILLLASLILIHEDAVFPGYWAILPVLGSIFLISAGPGGIVNRTLLANPTMILIGKISYPLYLWHWPLLSYARITEQEPPSIAMRAAAIVLAFVLAYLTYFMIERRVRSGRYILRKSSASVVIMLVIAIISGLTVQRRGLPDRAVLTGIAVATPWQESVAASQSPCPFMVGTYKDCYLFDGKGDEDVLLLGDSHAGHLVPGIAATKPRDLKFGAMILNGGCPPLLGLERLLKHAPIALANYGKTSVSCAKINEARIGYAVRSSAKVVMLSMLTTGYDTPDKKGEFRYSFDGKPGPRLQIIANGLQRTVDRLTHAGKIVILVEDNPSYKRLKVEKCLTERPLSLSSTTRVCSRSRASIVKDNLAIATLYQKAHQREPGLVLIFKTLPILCPSRICSMKINGISMYRDSGHLSVEGSKFVMRRFIPSLVSAASMSR